MVIQFTGACARPVNLDGANKVGLVGGGFENQFDTESHAAEPLKDIEDIWKVQEYLISKGLYRDNLLFTAGINFGLRISDLLQLKVGHLLNSTGTGYNEKVVLQEKKTSKQRVVWMNDAVMDAADLYFSDLMKRKGAVDLNDFLFTSNSANGSNINRPIARRNVERLLKAAINDGCGIDVHASTHCLRKTFAYHVIMTAKDRPRAVEFLQKIFGHSSMSITLMYAGITDDEIMGTYKALNLGRGYNFERSSGLVYQYHAV